MDLNLRAAQDALSHPSEQVLETMRGASSEAQAAVASMAPSSSALASLSTNSNSAGAAASAQSNGTNGANDGGGAGQVGESTPQEDTSRLQVVDEVNRFERHRGTRQGDD